MSRLITLLSNKNTTVATPVKFEAETGTLAGSVIIATDHSGYTGTGFIAQFITVQFGSVTIPVTASIAGATNVSIRYANGNAGTQTLSIYVNSGKIKQTSFPATANWDTWGNVVEVLTLNAGSNTIGLSFDSGDTGGVNIDFLMVGG